MAYLASLRSVAASIPESVATFSGIRKLGAMKLACLWMLEHISGGRTD
jgi:hypothetical protein